MASQRELRGFDAARLRAALFSMTLPTLRCVLESSELPASGAKPDVAQRIHLLIVSGRLPVHLAFSSGPKVELQRACDTLGVNDYGTTADLIERIDGAVRYSPLGDASLVAAAVACHVDQTLDERARLFVIELHARLADRSRGSTTLKLGELIGRLGWRRAEFRARSAAGRQVGDMLWMNGVATDPDLRALTTSPGVDGEITLRLRTDWDHGAAPTVPSHVASSSALEYDLVESVAQLGMGVSRADQVVHESELAQVRQQAASSVRGAGLGERQRLDEFILRLYSADVNVEEAAHRVAARFTLEQRSKLFEHLFEVAIADGVVVEEEAQLLRRLETILRPAPALLDSLLDGVRQPLAGTYAEGTSNPPRRAQRVAAPATAEISANVDTIMNLLFP